MNRGMWPIMGLLLVLIAGDTYSMHRALGKMLQPRRGHAGMMAHLWRVQQRPSYLHPAAPQLLPYGKGSDSVMGIEKCSVPAASLFTDQERIREKVKEAVSASQKVVVDHRCSGTGIVCFVESAIEDSGPLVEPQPCCKKIYPSLLSIAVLYGNDAAVSLLLTHTAKDAGKGVSSDEVTFSLALHYAAYCGESAIAKRLIKAGHRIDIPDAEGYTPVEYALAGENNELAILLGEWQALQDSLLLL